MTKVNVLVIVISDNCLKQNNKIKNALRTLALSRTRRDPMKYPLIATAIIAASMAMPAMADRVASELIKPIEPAVITEPAKAELAAC